LIDFKNFLRAIFFGILSILFGFVQFNLPIIEGVNSSLSEIPMLLSVLYISNPWYLIIVSAVASIGPLTWISLLSFLIHTLGLILFYFYNKRIVSHHKDHDVSFVGFSSLGVLGYYLILTIPLVIIGANKSPEVDYWNVFISLAKSVSFEAIATMMIVALYILQNKATLKLKEHLLSLEDIVKQRTTQLDKTIAKLNEANDELKANNESLDQVVANRTKELENRNIQLTGYAFINSHLLRAPIARILGLSNIIKYELKSVEDETLIDKLMTACHELDEVVSLLSHFLSDESILSKNQLEELQERIMQIATEIKDIERS